MRIKISLIILLILLVSVFGVVASCSLTDVVVEGCELSSAEEIKEKITEYAPMGNSLLLYIKNRMKPFTSAAFVAKTDITFEGRNKVIVTVYEKMAAGCVSYMENYIYFDKDGNVLETSPELKKGVPNVSGLNINNWQMGEKLPIQDDKKFKVILNLTQLIEKYSLTVNGIAFTQENEVILQCGTINVELGSGENLSVQMMNLGTILEGLAGKSGTLYMKEFVSNESSASFKASAVSSNNKNDAEKKDGEDSSEESPEGNKPETPEKEEEPVEISDSDHEESEWSEPEESDWDEESEDESDETEEEESDESEESESDDEDSGEDSESEYEEDYDSEE